MEQLLKPSIWRACIAPWRYVLRPARAVQETGHAPRAAGWVTLFAASILTTLVILLAIAWAASTRVQYRDNAFELVHRPWSEGWTQQQGLGDQTLIVRFVFVFALIGAICTLVIVAVLTLPLTAGRDGFRASFRRAGWLAGSGLGFTAIMACIIALLIAWLDNLDDARRVDVNVWPSTLIVESIAISVLFAIPGVLACWWAFASRAVPAVAPADEPPHCEECGYDLTHQPESRRCPECGTSLDESLTKDIARPGPAWRSGESNVYEWLETTREVLLRPRQAYRRMAVHQRTARDLWFAASHLVVLALAMLSLVFCVMIGSFSESEEVMIGVVLSLFVAPFLAWLLLRGVAVVATLWALFGKLFHDPAVLWTIVRYETATVWYFFLFNAPLALVVRIFFEPLAVSSRLGGTPSGTAFSIRMAIGVIQVTGFIVILLFCLWRYRIAAKAVRWSRF